MNITSVSTISRNKICRLCPPASQALADLFSRYNEIDTARTYVGGLQEAFSREARWKERGLTLATKCYPQEPGMHKAEELKKSCDKSLSELGADCVDIFYLHAPVSCSVSSKQVSMFSAAALHALPGF